MENSTDSIEIADQIDFAKANSVLMIVNRSIATISKILIIQK